MIKVITAYHPKHQKYLPGLRKSLFCYNNTEFDFNCSISFEKNGIDVRNKGIKKASDDDILFFLDADDMPLPYCLDFGEVIMKNTGCDILYGNQFILQKNGVIRLSPKKDFHMDDQKKDGVIHGSGAFVRAHIAKQCYFPKASYGADWYFLTMCSMLTNKIIHSNDVFIIYREWTGRRLFRRINIPIVRKVIRKYCQKKMRRRIGNEI